MLDEAQVASEYALPEFGNVIMVLRLVVSQSLPCLSLKKGHSLT